VSDTPAPTPAHASGSRPALIPISSLDDPRLAPYRNVKDRDLDRLRSGLHASAAPGLFLVEGELVVRQLTSTRFPIDSVLLTPNRADSMADWLASLPSTTPVFLVPQDTMNLIVGFDIHRGVLAAAQRGTPLDADQLIAESRVLVVLEDLTNHDNVGGIFRTLAGLAGVEQVGVLLSPRTCDPLYRKSVRVSIGQAMRVPFATLEPWPAGLTRLRHAGFTLVATTPGPDSTPLDACPRPERTALLVGSEGPGLTPQALAHADQRVRIPMRSSVDSLNVVVATGIALHALLRPPESPPGRPV
jgi:tRNA G18 (ribose-2'-O)-methylase SpoU